MPTWAWVLLAVLGTYLVGQVLWILAIVRFWKGLK